MARYEGVCGPVQREVKQDGAKTRSAVQWSSWWRRVADFSQTGDGLSALRPDVLTPDFSISYRRHHGTAMRAIAAVLIGLSLASVRKCLSIQ